MSTVWFYIIDEREHGPIESKTLKLLAEVGQITPNTLVRKATSKNWAEAHQVKQLFGASSSTQQTTDVAPISEQSCNAKREIAVPVQPPKINIVAPPILNEDLNPNNAAAGELDGENIAVEHVSSKRPMVFVLVLVGLILLTIPTAWILYSKPTTTAGNAKSQVNHPPAANANLSASANSRSEKNRPPNHSKEINDVFTKQSQWIDPTNEQFQLTSNAGLSITHVWVDTQQTEQILLNVVIRIENRNKSTALLLQRQFANQNEADRPDKLSPYVPLISLAAGNGHTLDSETKLVNRTIPMASAIRETYQITLTAEQAAELDQLQVAVPKAWVNRSGYWGFKIPQIMVASTKPVQAPLQIASEPDATSGNPRNAQPNVVGGENNGGTKSPADGKGVLPPSPFGNNPPVAKPNGDQPSTLDELRSQIDQQEKKRDPKPHGDALQK